MTTNEFLIKYAGIMDDARQVICSNGRGCKNCLLQFHPNCPIFEVAEGIKDAFERGRKNDL
jgi:hypothetical protein